jgi:hypothetical protein
MRFDLAKHCMATTTVTSGKQAVKLNQPSSRGKPLFQLAYDAGGRRLLKNFSDKGRAKRVKGGSSPLIADQTTIGRSPTFIGFKSARLIVRRSQYNILLSPQY